MDPRYTDALPATADVVVIGGGIVGTATAFFLARSGRRPVVVERMPRLADTTTRVSAHAVRCQFSEPENIDQTKESLAIYEGFAHLLDRPGAGRAIGLCQQGYLFASTEPAELDAFRARVERQRALGVDDVELLDGDEIVRRFPWMTRDVAVGTFRQRDGWLDATAAAVELAAASGAPVHMETTVTSIDVEAGRVTGVTTDRGRISTRDVVLAAGPLSRTLAPEPLPVAPLAAAPDRRPAGLARPSGRSNDDRRQHRRPLATAPGRCDGRLGAAGDRPRSDVAGRDGPGLARPRPPVGARGRPPVALLARARRRADA
jgi:sarcosine oxidase subunit beta